MCVPPTTVVRKGSQLETRVSPRARLCVSPLQHALNHCHCATAPLRHCATAPAPLRHCAIAPACHGLCSARTQPLPCRSPGGKTATQIASPELVTLAKRKHCTARPVPCRPPPPGRRAADARRGSATAASGRAAPAGRDPRTESASTAGSRRCAASPGLWHVWQEAPSWHSRRGVPQTPPTPRRAADSAAGGRWGTRRVDASQRAGVRRLGRATGDL